MEDREENRSEPRSSVTGPEYQELFDANPLPIWVCQNDAQLLVGVNTAAARKFGFHPSEIVNKPAAELVHIEDRPRFKEMMSGRYDEPIFTDGFRLLRSDDASIECEIHWKSLNHKNLILLTIVDVSERKRAEIRLRAAYGELTAFKNAINAASIVAVTDTRGDIVEVNDNFCKISGYSRDDLIGQNHRLVNSGLHTRDFFQDLWKTITQSRVWRAELRNRRKDGSYYWVDTTISPIVDERDRPVRYLAIRNDITKRKEAEEKARHAENNLKILQDRMSPHFLFNTLSIIHAFLTTNVDMADAAILMLADNYRFIIQHSYKEMIPFDVEWEFMANYARLLGLRHPDTTSMEIHKESDFTGFQIPPLTLQPLVENAYKHGIRDRREGGKICATARVHGDTGIVTVTDNGSGLAGVDVFKGTLGNIAERLRYYSPGAEFTVLDQPGGGTEATIKFRRSSSK